MEFFPRRDVALAILTRGKKKMQLVALVAFRAFRRGVCDTLSAANLARGVILSIKIRGWLVALPNFVWTDKKQERVG